MRRIPFRQRECFFSPGSASPSHRAVTIPLPVKRSEKSLLSLSPSPGTLRTCFRLAPRTIPGKVLFGEKGRNAFPPTFPPLLEGCMYCSPAKHGFLKLQKGLIFLSPMEALPPPLLSRCTDPFRPRGLIPLCGLTFVSYGVGEEVVFFF